MSQDENVGDYTREMGFLGPHGTHSEEAAIYLKEVLGIKEKLRPYPDIYSAMQAVEDGEIESCIVPVENSLEGSINITLDVLAHTDSLQVTAELVWPVHNHLMVKDDTVPIKKIFSHAQPLAQCREFLRKNYPGVPVYSTASTAKAAEMVAESDGAEGYAAICTRRSGEIYNLKAVNFDIQDNDTNCTRFYELHRSDHHIKRANGIKTLVICQVDGSKAGSLYGVLAEFAKRNVNMTRIESRPAKTGLGEYIFFFDLEFDDSKGPEGITAQKEQLAQALKIIRVKSKWLRNPGVYPVIQGVSKAF